MLWNKIEEEGPFELSSSGLWSSDEIGYMAEWRARFADLEEMFELKPNWDGEGAEAPSHALLDSVGGLLLRMYTQNESPPARIVPTLDGTITMEWQDVPGYRECEVVSPSLVEWFLQSPSGGSASWEEQLLAPSETWVVEQVPEDVVGESESELLWQEQYSIAA